MQYVYSTLTSDNRYTFYTEGGGDLKVAEHHILVKGGTGIANDRLITPRGVVTEISDSDAELLKEHPIFKLHQDNGFVLIDTKKYDPEKAAGNLAAADGSAPLTEAHYKAKGKGKQQPNELVVTTNVSNSEE